MVLCWCYLICALSVLDGLICWRVCAVVREKQMLSPPEEELPLKAFATLSKALPQASLQRFRSVYVRMVTELRGLLSTTEAYVRPMQSRGAHPFVQRGMPEIRRDKFDFGAILDKTKFAAKACARPSPFASADAAAAAALPNDLCLAIEHSIERGSSIRGDRTQRLARLRQMAGELDSMRRVLDECKCETASKIAAEFNVAWTSAIVDAMQWPDTELPLRYVLGHETVFDIADSGVFRADEQPATLDADSFREANTRMNARIASRIKTSALHGDAEQRERRKQAWKRTCEEIKEGLVGPPRSRAQVDRKYGRGKWRAIGRSAITQKGKWRCIDDGRRSKHNGATTLHERITCGRADFPVLVAREFARRMQAHARKAKSTVRKPPHRLRMRHGTNDLRAAYRRVPTSQPEYTLVAVWNEDEQQVCYCEVPGHNFGLTSAVVNFNRFPELVVAAAARRLWVVTEHYFDDNDTCEPSWAGDSGQDCLVELCGNGFFGLAFDPGKHVRMSTSNEYLGVESSLSRAHEGILEMDVSVKRRKKMRELAVSTRASGKLGSGLAASIFGKARFMMSPCYGSLGKACLQPIMRREYDKSRVDIDDELRDSLEFIEFVCDHMPPLQLPLLPDDSRPVVVFTDAEGKKRKGGRDPSGHVGFVVYHPTLGKAHARAQVPPSLVRLMDKIKQRETYISQFELVATIIPFISLPAEWFRGRPIELWVDNSPAVGGLIKGYSGVPDCARIINMFHFAIARLGVSSLWIDYVPTESNPADVPSRAHAMGAAEAVAALKDFGMEVRAVIPTFADEAGEWLPSVAIGASVWGS